jgi:hypothetical protein
MEPTNQEIEDFANKAYDNL